MSEQEILTGLWECSVCFPDKLPPEVMVSPPQCSEHDAYLWGSDRVRDALRQGREAYVMRVRPTSQMSLL